MGKIGILEVAKRIKDEDRANQHPKDCKGCPDCPATWTCKCGKSFDKLNTEHDCRK